MAYDASLFDLYYEGAGGGGSIEHEDPRRRADRKREREIRQRMSHYGFTDTQINQKMGHLAMMGEHPSFYLSTIEDAGDFVVRAKTYEGTPGEVFAVWNKGPSTFVDLALDFFGGAYNIVSAPFRDDFWEDWTWLKWIGTMAFAAWSGYHIGRWSANTMRKGLYDIGEAVFWGGPRGWMGAGQVLASVAVPPAITYGLSYLPGKLGEWAPYAFGGMATVGSYLSHAEAMLDLFPEIDSGFWMRWHLDGPIEAFFPKASSTWGFGPSVYELANFGKTAADLTMVANAAGNTYASEDATS